MTGRGQLDRRILAVAPKPPAVADAYRHESWIVNRGSWFVKSGYTTRAGRHTRIEFGYAAPLGLRSTNHDPRFTTYAIVYPCVVAWKTCQDTAMTPSSAPCWTGP